MLGAADREEQELRAVQLVLVVESQGAALIEPDADDGSGARDGGATLLGGDVRPHEHDVVGALREARERDDADVLAHRLVHAVSLRVVDRHVAEVVARRQGDDDVRHQLERSREEPVARLGARPDLLDPHLRDEALGLHVLEPDRIVGGENELGVREFQFQQVADLAPVARVYRHEHVVQDGESEVLAHGVFHEGQIEAKSHAILVAFAVIGTRREKAAPVEINIEAELAD